MPAKILLTGGLLSQTAAIHNSLSSAQFSVYLADAQKSENSLAIPKANDSAFAHKILKICLDKDIKVVIPQLNEEIELLAPAKTLFREYGILVLCPDKNQWDVLKDKAGLLETLQKVNVEVPAFKKLEVFENFASSMLQVGYPSKRIQIEPAEYNSNVFRIVDDKVNTFQLLFPQDKKPLISYTQLSRLLSTDDFPFLLLTEYIEGTLVLCSTYCREGQLVVFGEGNEQLQQRVEQIVSYLNLNGCFTFQFVQKEDHLYLTQLNHTLNNEKDLLLYLTHELKELDGDAGAN